MKIALLGPEIEENLALRYIAASLVAAGHEPRLFDFHEERQLPAVADAVVAWGPELVGLSMVFTLRSREFMDLARRLRQRGYRGHITAGGHFAALHARELLEEGPILDSVIAGEGETPMVELAASLSSPGEVYGLTWRDAGGAVHRSPPRANRDDLDAIPWPLRPERFHSYLDQPIANLLSGRGCYFTCAFCSITAFHREIGGKRFRQREVGAVAAEMAHLYHDRGVRIFNFQDDNFFLPRAADNLERLRALQAALAAAGVGRIGIQAKGRPDAIEPEVIDQLVAMGLFRLFLGVETDAVVGLKTLGRGIEREQNHRALAILRERELHTCFNLLIFDPESTFEAIRQNLDFMRRQSYFPLNFCRVEVYAGTPIEARLRAEGRLRGDLYGWSYTIRDPRVQLAYEIFRDVFWARNFGPGGLHHESMKLDYNYHLLRHFWPERAGRAVERRVKGLVLELNRDSAALMGRICDFAESGAADGELARARFVAESAAARQRFDDALRPRLDDALRELEALAEARVRRRAAPGAVPAAAAAAILVTASGCWNRSSNGQTHMCEMAPPPPRPVGELTPDEQQRVSALVQQRVNNELYVILQADGLTNVPITLQLEINDGGALVGCTGQPPATVTKLCERLVETRFPIEPRGADAVMHAEVTVVWSQPDQIDDTHMCEMAPPPNDYDY